MFLTQHICKVLVLVSLLISLANNDVRAQKADNSSLEELIEKQERQIMIVTLAALLPVIVLFIFGFFFYYRIKRETQFRERELELKYAKSEMEMRALRAQVNPHFIFNCLSSIQHAIHHKDTIQAERQLVKFSRLIRQVLEQSSNAFISLAEDLEILELYIELEMLRLDNLFSYEIIVGSGIDRGKVFVPPMLLQPLVENAIWHGLTNRRTSDGKLEVRFEKEEEALICYILDNGVKNDNQSNHNGKSHGLRLVRERIRLHTDENEEVSLKLDERIGVAGIFQGMQVRLKIPTEPN